MRKCINVFVMIFIIASISSCKKKTNDTNEQVQTPPPPVPTPTCPNCIQHTPTNNPANMPDSVLQNVWYKEYFIFSNGSYIDTTGIDVVGQNTFAVNDCSKYTEFYPSWTLITKGLSTPDFSFTIHMPIDSVQLLNFSKGLYAIKSVDNNHNNNCKGEVSLKYHVNSVLWESVSQNNTATYYNEIQDLYLTQKSGIARYYIKGRTNILMKNLQNMTMLDTVSIRYKFKIWYYK